MRCGVEERGMAKAFEAESPGWLGRERVTCESLTAFGQVTFRPVALSAPATMSGK